MNYLRIKSICFISLLFLLLVCCGIKDGPIETFYSNGNKKVEGFILNGQKEGVWKYYDEDGDIFRKQKFINGIERENINYFKNGQINFIYNYDANHKKIGESRTYYDNGQIQAQTHYSDARIDSTRLFFFKDGNIKQFAVYDNGKRVGIWVYFNNHGDTLKVEIYRNDSLINTIEYQ